MEALMPDNRRVYSRVGFALLLMLTLTFALQLGAQMLASFLGWQITAGSWAYYLVTLLPQYLVGMPLAAAVIAGIPAAQGMQKIKLPAKWFFIFGAICLFLMYAGNLIGTLISSILSALAGTEMQNPLTDIILDTDVWLRLAAVALVAPVVEELFFRKLLIGRLHGYGQRAAVVVSAVAFALSHGNFSQVFYAFGLGLAFGYIYFTTNRIRYTIILHMIINLLGSVVGPLVMSAGTVFVSAYSGLILAGVIAGLVIYIRYRKQLGFPDEYPIGRRIGWKKPAFFNTGMMLFFIVCAALFALNTWWALQPPA